MDRSIPQTKDKWWRKQPKLSDAQSLKLDLYFWLQALTISLISLILIFTLVGRIIRVDGVSMLPTLHHQDLLLIQGLGYEPQQGDIVVLTKAFRIFNSPIVKRVIAVGGQTVEIDYESHTVFVDGQPLDEPYINPEEVMTQPSYENLTSVTVPEGSIFVMGDNRNHSSDSRDVELGVVDNRYVLGKAVIILFPFEDFGMIEGH